MKKNHNSLYFNKLHKEDQKKTGIDRRKFLKLAMTGTAATFLPRFVSLANGSTLKDDRTAQAVSVYRRLHGPQAAISVPFTENYDVDYDSLRKWVEFMCNFDDPPILFFTYGDGEVDALTEEEVAQINLTAAKQADGRALVVGATGPWWTGRKIDFVKRMEDGGLEAINLHFSTRIVTEAQLYPAFEQIAEQTEIPLLIYEHSNMPTSLIKKISTVPQVVGVKSHASLYAFYDQIRHTRDTKFAVLGAGQMKQFIYGAQIGSPGYLCPLAPVAPQVSRKFYNAVKTGEWEKAHQIVIDYEEPLLDATIPLGYPQAYKALLYLAGLYSTHKVRLPRITPPVEDLNDLKSFLEEKNIIS